MWSNNPTQPVRRLKYACRYLKPILPMLIPVVGIALAYVWSVDKSNPHRKSLAQTVLIVYLTAILAFTLFLGVTIYARKLSQKYLRETAYPGAGESTRLGYSAIADCPKNIFLIKRNFF